MATNRSGHRPAGGLHSNKIVHRPHGKAEPRANAYRPQGVSQWGQMQGNHVTRAENTNYRGEEKRGGAGYNPPLGITDPVKAVGVAGGREVHSSGSQGVHGATNPGNPRPAGRDILSEFGPNKRSY